MILLVYAIIKGLDVLLNVCFCPFQALLVAVVGLFGKEMICLELLVNHKAYLHTTNDYLPVVQCSVPGQSDLEHRLQALSNVRSPRPLRASPEAVPFGHSL